MKLIKNLSLELWYKKEHQIQRVCHCLKTVHNWTIGLYADIHLIPIFPCSEILRNNTKIITSIPD